MRKTRRAIVLLAALVLFAFHHAAPMMPTGHDGMPSGSGMPEKILLAGACLAVASGRVRVALRRILEICLESPAKLVTRVKRSPPAHGYASTQATDAVGDNAFGSSRARGGEALATTWLASHSRNCASAIGLANR